jgi:phosphate acyltransferase
MRIALDAMGGDHAPEEMIKGAYLALEQFDDIHIDLFGDQEKMAPFLKEHPRLTINHCSEVIEGEDEPVRAIRRKKDSSMVKMAEAVKNAHADACVSAGNTGALMAAGLFVVGRIEGVERPALAPTLPTVDGKGFVMLDLGANADAKPEHLIQFAIMGSVYAEKVRGISRPRVGLLNIGTEDKKGNDLTKAAHDLLKEAPVNFVGNVEARDLLDGVADVVVTDGFTGNMVLKSIEGTASAIFKLLKGAFMATPLTKVSAVMMKKELKSLKGMLDYSEYGGAGLFGLKAPVIKAHGSSDANAVMNAIRQARTMVQHDVIGTIRDTIEGRK